MRYSVPSFDRRRERGGLPHVTACAAIVVKSYISRNCEVGLKSASPTCRASSLAYHERYLWLIGDRSLHQGVAASNERSGG
jgi:hypothetical protein